MNKYYRYYVKKNITVQNIVTIEYLDISSDFKSERETHSFFELAYVDKGAIFCCSREEEFYLRQGEMFFHLPNTEHNYRSANEKDTRLFIVCANCKTDILELISGKHTLDESEKAQVADIFSEAKKAFRFPFEKKLVPLEASAFGAQQLTESYIEILLTRLIRKRLSVSPEIKFVMNSEEFNTRIVKDLLELLNEKVYSHISLDEICSAVHYSKTYINNIFKKNIGLSIMQYFYSLKISEAKKLLNKGLTISEISDKLAYDNPNYFTKAFKSFTGISPSQYKKSINK